jgi:outer membrane autotransporter protein
MTAGAFTISPAASLKWLHMTTDDYIEAGSGLLDLSVAGTSLDQLESMLGARLTTSVGTSIGTLVPELRVGWLHDFIADGVDTKALIEGVSFSTSTLRASANGLSIGGGLSLIGEGNIMINLGYDGDFRKGYGAHAAELQVRMQF